MQRSRLAAFIIIFCALAYGAGCAVPGSALAQTKYPAKPIRLIVSFSAGGTPDTLARLLGPRVSEALGQPIVIENRPGAGGTLATNLVAKAPADGYTLLAVSPGFAITAAMQPNLPYDPLKDFSAVANIGFSTLALVVAPSLGVKSLKELITLAHAQPGKMFFGSAGAGSGTHMNGERFRLVAGIKAVHVAFKGQPEFLIEVMAARVQYGVAGLGPAMPMIKEGRLLPLAVLPARAEIIEQVLLKINGEIFTKSDLEQRQVQALRQQLGPGVDLKNATDAQIRKSLDDVTPQVMVSVIEEILLVQRGRELGYKLADDYRKALLGEPMKLIEHIVRNGRPFTEIVTADYWMVSPYGARGYGNFSELKEKFKDPNTNLRLVFVCAMWITGFDVPTCSTIYLDKPMRNHTLMQTIARANRVFPGKHSGVIVDYANGVRASLDLCMFAEASRQEQEIRVVGSLGKVEADVPGDGSIHVGRRADRSVTPVPVPLDPSVAHVEKMPCRYLTAETVIGADTPEAVVVRIDHHHRERC